MTVALDGRRVPSSSKYAAWAWAEYAYHYGLLNDRAQALFETADRRGLSHQALRPYAVHWYQVRRTLGVCLEVAGLYYDRLGMRIDDLPSAVPRGALRGEVDRETGRLITEWSSPADWRDVGRDIVWDVNRVLPAPSGVEDLTRQAPQGMGDGGATLALGGLLTVTGAPAWAVVGLAVVGIAAAAAVICYAFKLTAETASATLNRDVVTQRRTQEDLGRALQDCLSLPTEAERTACQERMLDAIRNNNRASGLGLPFLLGAVVLGGIALSLGSRGRHDPQPAR